MALIQVKFRLSLTFDDQTKRFDPTKDTMFVCGSADFLGAWNLKNAVEMKLKPSSLSNQSFIDKVSNMSVSSLSLSSISSTSEFLSAENTVANNNLEFETVIYIDSSQNIAEVENYKYFFAQKTSISKDKFFIKQVEYHHRHLKIDINSSQVKEVNDTWPSEDTESKPYRVDYGWLLDGENEFQFHFSNNPIQLWMPTTEQKYLWSEIVPWRAYNGLYELKDYFLTHSDFDTSQIFANKKSKFNALNFSDCYTSFRFRTFENPFDLLFQINLYEIDDDGKLNDKIIATGYYKVTKPLLENSLIDIELSLLSSNQIIGSLKTEILLITSMQEQSNFMIKKNYNYHFNRSCVPIGHRGMGKTFDADASLPNTNFVENTIESFREAYNRGAQMVEFDIVLTKDKIPIVYHDFIFCIDQLADKTSNNYISIAVNQLTYEEVKQGRIYSHKILKNAAKILSNDARDFFTSKTMFPTLKEMCHQLDQKLGFNVEIKYPIDLEDGSQEIDSHIKWLNRNEYVDVVIKELYQWCADDQRCVIITTFDPNLCSMLRIKQSKFPVLFLTNGITKKWIPYKDARCRNTQRSLNYAKAENLHGIVAHAEELTANMHLVNILFSNIPKSANFLAYSWGDQMNEADKRKLLTQCGINGIIYDRINESTTESE